MKQKQERLRKEKPATMKKDEAAAVACDENGKRTIQMIKIERSCSNDDEGIDQCRRSEVCKMNDDNLNQKTGRVV